MSQNVSILHIGGRAAVLPNIRVMDRLTGLSIPDHRRFSLIRKSLSLPDRQWIDWLSREPAWRWPIVSTKFRADHARPSRLRIVLTELLLSHARMFADRSKTKARELVVP